jgi:hypothetical protein
VYLEHLVVLLYLVVLLSLEHLVVLLDLVLLENLKHLGHLY